jgi:uncharacterized protein (TIGR03435 family)
MNRRDFLRANSSICAGWALSRADGQEAAGGSVSTQVRDERDHGGFFRSDGTGRPGPPVVDQTGLTGRFDFRLTWTPDESQFGAVGGYRPPATESPDAPQDLFTAVQEELGLKLELTKAMVDVLVIDHVGRPSAN